MVPHRPAQMRSGGLTSPPKVFRWLRATGPWPPFASLLLNNGDGCKLIASCSIAQLAVNAISPAIDRLADRKPARVCFAPSDVREKQWCRSRSHDLDGRGTIRCRSIAELAIDVEAPTVHRAVARHAAGVQVPRAHRREHERRRTRPDNVYGSAAAGSRTVAELPEAVASPTIDRAVSRK